MIYDAVVVGGGFYGATIAAYLASRGTCKKVVLVERQPGLMECASATNQARVHNGYHYPRSFTTAFRSRVNLPRFVRDFPDAVKRDFTNLYAIARRNSKVTARQFERFCREIGASLKPAPNQLSGLFDRRLVEQSYLVEEYVFDASVLRTGACQELGQLGVEIVLGTEVVGLIRVASGVEIKLVGPDGEGRIESRLVFNCTYSGLNRLRGDYPGALAQLKHEIAELALLEMPVALQGVGITVMDGPFFSLMPFPPRGLHTLSHVRYTPHLAWLDCPEVDPYRRLADYPRVPRVDRMLRDVERFMPAIREAKYVESLFEIKTVLVKNEIDDGRPILFERHANIPGCYTVLGGKIDNIYDIFEQLDNELL